MSCALSGKRILITGGSGYLGVNLVNALMGVDCHVTRLSRTPSQIDQSLGTAAVCDAAADVSDVTTWPCVLREVDIVVHLAAQTSAYDAERDPSADWAANVQPMLHLLECCRTQEIKPLILFAGTVTQVGMSDRLPVDERHPDRPNTVYDLHKLMAEQYLKHYCNRKLVRGAVLRLANVYGPGPSSGKPDRGVLNVMVRRAMAGEPLTVYGPGGHLRDYVYVQDAAGAFIAAATRPEAINGRHFVIGSGTGHLLVDAVNLVADRVALRTGRRAEVKHVEPPSSLLPIESRDFVADATAFRQATGWTPRVELQEGIDRMVEAFL